LLHFVHFLRFLYFAFYVSVRFHGYSVNTDVQSIFRSKFWSCIFVTVRIKMLTIKFFCLINISGSFTHSSVHCRRQSIFCCNRSS